MTCLKMAAGAVASCIPRHLAALAIALLFLAMGADAFAHAVTEGDKGYIMEISGVKLIPFVYLGAKHMVTGYDHLLFLARKNVTPCRPAISPRRLSTFSALRPMTGGSRYLKP